MAKKSLSKLLSSSVKAVEPHKKITNSDTEFKKKFPHGQVFSPTSFQTKHSKIDKVMKYEMNMTYGKGYGNNTKNIDTYFDRLYSVYLNIELDSLCQYVFMVRPDLNIYTSSGDLVSLTSSQKKSGYYPNSCPNDDQFFRYMHKQYPRLLKHLTSNLSQNHDFMPYLVGRTESLQIPDYAIKEYKMNQPCTNYNLPYAGNASESTTGGVFDITFREDSDLKIHKLFQAWIYYINNVTKNMFGPKITYIQNNKIDYATSVYCITCKADAETIVYWTKYTGAFPTAVPNSDLSFNLRGSVNKQLTIPFSYFLQEPMDPYILVDFNKNAHVTKSNGEGFIPTYRSNTLKYAGFKDYRTAANKKMDKKLLNAKVSINLNSHEVLGSGNGLVGCPFIYKDSKGIYKLRWKKLPSDISGKK